MPRPLLGLMPDSWVSSLAILSTLATTSASAAPGTAATQEESPCGSVQVSAAKDCSKVQVNFDLSG